MINKILLSHEQATIKYGKRRKDKTIDLFHPLTKPFLKWAGGKQWLSRLAPNLKPKKFTGRYYEPFLGGGSFFFAMEPARATLSDKNIELIETYKAVKRNSEEIINILNTYPYDEQFYYNTRSKVPNKRIEIATRLLYLNKTCWNGLYRVNNKGNFNTPFGKYVNPTICDPQRLISASKLLRRAKLTSADFHTVAKNADAGDFVFFDPPYITGHTNNGFHKYNAHLFSWSDQERLQSVINALSDKGVYVLLSNAFHDSIIKLYSNYMIHVVERKSLIGGRGSLRGTIKEVLISNYNLFDN